MNILVLVDLDNLGVYRDEDGVVPPAPEGWTRFGFSGFGRLVAFDIPPPMPSLEHTAVVEIGANTVTCRAVLAAAAAATDEGLDPFELLGLWANAFAHSFGAILYAWHLALVPAAPEAVDGALKKLFLQSTAAADRFDNVGLLSADFGLRQWIRGKLKWVEPIGKKPKLLFPLGHTRGATGVALGVRVRPPLGPRATFGDVLAVVSHTPSLAIYYGPTEAQVAGVARLMSHCAGAPYLPRAVGEVLPEVKMVRPVASAVPGCVVLPDDGTRWSRVPARIHQAVVVGPHPLTDPEVLTVTAGYIDQLPYRKEDWVWVSFAAGGDDLVCELEWPRRIFPPDWWFLGSTTTAKHRIRWRRDLLQQPGRVPAVIHSADGAVWWVAPDEALLGCGVARALLPGLTVHADKRLILVSKAHALAEGEEFRRLQYADVVSFLEKNGAGAFRTGFRFRWLLPLPVVVPLSLLHELGWSDPN